MDSKDRLLQICANKIKEKGLGKEYKEKLKAEISEIGIQGEHDYFLDLYDQGAKFSKNENNLLIVFLLGLVDDFDITAHSAFSYGEFPDIDIDYIPIVRDYLKNEWAPKTFGVKNVCNIGNYATFGIKSALIDMVRVHGEDRNEILGLTTKLPTKDGDGRVLTFDKAIATNKDLSQYCQDHPDIVKAAKKLINRNRGKGKHAGGLIISKSSIDNLVPLIVDSDGVPTSAWVEGLHSQDLQPVGLIKFDLLVVVNLVPIAVCTQLVKERHGLESICALPGLSDWTDTSYLEDQKALQIANQGKLKCIFQFDSAGMQEMVKRGGVASFDDLAAYTALYRPGPLNCLKFDTMVSVKGGKKEIADLKNWHDEIAYVNFKGDLSYTHQFALWKTNKKKILRIVTKKGVVLECSGDHRILSKGNKFKTVKSMKIGDKIAVKKL